VCGSVAAPPGVSQVPLCPIFDIKIYKDFSEIFQETLFLRIFQKNDKGIKLRKNEDKTISSKSKPSMQQL
jgi:hypothetical protein